MPQLLSRMDDHNWLTPSIADILEQGAAPPGGDGTMRETVIQLQEAFAALETPVRVINVRPTPSYTLFVLQPEIVGRLANRRTITPAELRRSIAQIAEKRKEWRLGFLAQVEDTPEAVGLLMRTEKHHPLSLRRLLIRGSFRDYPSSLAFTLGNTLDQRLIVKDLESAPHLLLVGEQNTRQHLITGLLLTLILLNTPNEIHLSINGQGSEGYGEFVHLPHIVSAKNDLADLLSSVINEGQARIERFYEEGVNQLKTYNERMRDQGKPALPHLLIVLDPLSDDPQIIPMVRDLLVNGAQSGIHLVATVNQSDVLPATLKGLFPVEVFMRSAAPELGEKLKNWHTSLQRFIDAFIIDRTVNEVIPVELCAVTPGEVRASVDYWRSIASQRKQEPAGVITPFAPPSLKQAAMLAAYLGWISHGALRDIFALSETDAAQILQGLQVSGIVENSSDSMCRFIRLAEFPK
jgi:hypothetical protein